MNLTDRLSDAGHTALGVAKSVGYHCAAVPVVTFLLPGKYSMRVLDGLAERLHVEEWKSPYGSEALRSTLSLLVETGAAIALAAPSTTEVIALGSRPAIEGDVYKVAIAAGILLHAISRGVFYSGKAIPAMPMHVAYCALEAVGRLAGKMLHSSNRETPA